MYIQSESTIYRFTLVASLLLMVASVDLTAQNDDDTSLPPFRFGGLLGLNINAITLDDTGIDPYDFAGRAWGDNDAGGGAGYIGGHFSYVPGTFGLQIRAAYDGRGGRFIDGGAVSSDVTSDPP